MDQLPVITIRRVFNIGNFETIALEMSQAIADPDKTLRSTDEEIQLSRLHVTRMINQLAIQEITRIHSYRSSNPHPNVELREYALSATTYTYNQLIAENKALDAEIASLQQGRHTYSPEGTMLPVNPSA